MSTSDRAMELIGLAMCAVLIFLAAYAVTLFVHEVIL